MAAMAVCYTKKVKLIGAWDCGGTGDDSYEDPGRSFNARTSVGFSRYCRRDHQQCKKRAHSRLQSHNQAEKVLRDWDPSKTQTKRYDGKSRSKEERWCGCMNMEWKCQSPRIIFWPWFSVFNFDCTVHSGYTLPHSSSWIAGLSCISISTMIVLRFKTFPNPSNMFFWLIATMASVNLCIHIHSYPYSAPQN